MPVRKILALICTIFALCILGGCLPTVPSGTESGDFEQYKKIEVYSASDNTLLKSVENASVIKEFLTKTMFIDENITDEEFSDMLEQEQVLKEVVSDCQPLYIFVAYKASAVAGSTDLERIFDITTYSDTSIIKWQTSPDVIKNARVPQELLTHYYEASDDTTKYLQLFLTEPRQAL